MRYIRKCIEDLCKDETRADQYTLQNLNSSGTYMRNNLSYVVLTKVINCTTLMSSDPEVFLATKVTMCWNHMAFCNLLLPIRKTSNWNYFLEKTSPTSAWPLFIIQRTWIALAHSSLRIWLTFTGYWITKKDLHFQIW